MTTTRVADPAGRSSTGGSWPSPKSYTVPPGSVVVIADNAMTRESSHALAVEIARLSGHHDFTVVAVPNGDLSVLDEDEMKAHGWIRSPKERRR